MPFFDVRTIFVICAFFMFFYGFGMIAFARKMSDSFKGIYLLALVNFLIATGISLVLFRGYIDIVWSIIVGNSLLIIACNLIYHAHLQFIGYKNQHIFLSAVLLIGVISLLLIFTYIIPNTNDRVIVLSSFYSLQFLFIARTVQRFQQQTEQTCYSPLIIIASAFAAFFVFRLVITLFREQVDPYKLMYNPAQALATIFLMLYIALLDFCIVLIASGQLVQKIAELAYKDLLTTLYNRRGLDHTMRDNAIFDKPLAVIMCDIDHFKLINDRYGHAIGDIVLQTFAKLIKESTRKTDICTRWGGEEFLIILPMTTEQEALMVAEKIRTACEQLTFPEYPELRFTNSLGICSKKASHNFDELINDADHALYQAKTQGRNRVCIFNSEMGK
jgi:diguanylate cyclase (GGDEF)-like protein